MDALSALDTLVQYGVSQEDQSAGGNRFLKVPAEAPSLDLNIQEEVVSTSTSCNADSGMEQYIEQDDKEIGDDTSDDIFLEGESDITKDLNEN